MSIIVVVYYVVYTMFSSTTCLVYSMFWAFSDNVSNIKSNAREVMKADCFASAAPP